MSDIQDIFQATHILFSYLKVRKFIKPLHHRLRDFVGIYLHKALLD